MEPSALEEEALAIVSIYGPSTFYALPTPPSKAKPASAQPSTPVYTLKVSLEEPDFDYDPTASSDHHQGPPHQHSNRKELELRIYFPQGYPETNTTAPVHEIVSIYYGTLRLTDTMVQEITRGLEESFVPGEVVVFSWIEWLRNFLEELEQRDHPLEEEDDEDDEGDDDEEEGDEEISDEVEGTKAASDYFKEDSIAPDGGGDLGASFGSLSLQHADAAATTLFSATKSPRLAGGPPGLQFFKIRTGPPIIDRKSVFVAHLAPITQAGEVPYMIQQLKVENKKVIKATHNIMAFRVENENGTIAQDNDDDGETAAGSRLLHLMSILDVKNVVVVVSRWYGGIPLSADRFKHINNAARLLLDECGYIHAAQGSTPSDASSAAASKKKGKGKKSGKR